MIECKHKITAFPSSSRKSEPKNSKTLTCLMPRMWLRHEALKL
jgi:hypothetical protein